MRELVQKAIIRGSYGFIRLHCYCFMNRSAAIDIALVVLGGFVAAETLLGIYSLVSPLIDSPSLLFVFAFTPFWFSIIEATAGVVLTLVGYYRWKHRKQLIHRNSTPDVSTT